MRKKKLGPDWYDSLAEIDYLVNKAYAVASQIDSEFFCSDESKDQHDLLLYSYRTYKLLSEILVDYLEKIRTAIFEIR